MEFHRNSTGQSPYFGCKDHRFLRGYLAMPKCQVTVAKHMEMSPEDIAAALAYGCRKLVDEEWEMGWSCENLVKS